MSHRPLNCVVLIDDNALDNKLHRRVIEKSGLAKTVLEFPMAEDAIAYFRTPGAIPADLILLDINMPKMNGFELLEAVTEEFGEAFEPSVVIMLTTSLDARDQERANKFSVVKDYLSKPLRRETFADLVARLP